MTDDFKYLFIHLEVQDRDVIHDHRVLHITKANNLDFVAEKYVASFWGDGCLDKTTRWWNYGERAGRLVKYKRLSAKEYSLLSDLFY